MDKSARNVGHRHVDQSTFRATFVAVQFLAQATDRGTHCAKAYVQTDELFGDALIRIERDAGARRGWQRRRLVRSVDAALWRLDGDVLRTRGRVLVEPARVDPMQFAAKSETERRGWRRRAHARRSSDAQGGEGSLAIAHHQTTPARRSHQRVTRSASAARARGSASARVRSEHEAARVVGVLDVLDLGP